MVVCNRTSPRPIVLDNESATWADGPKAIAEAADLVIDGWLPKDVEEQYYGDGLLLVHMLVKFPAI